MKGTMAVTGARSNHCRMLCMWACAQFAPCSGLAHPKPSRVADDQHAKFLHTSLGLDQHLVHEFCMLVIMHSTWQLELTHCNTCAESERRLFFHTVQRLCVV